MPETLTQILAPFRGQRGALIPVLEKVQEEYGYLPEDTVSDIANSLRISKNEIYGVASFYALFRFEKPGEHMIRVCQGTACHVRGGPRVLEAVERELNTKTGQTTKDGKFSLERVACFGACALAPVMVIDKTVYSSMSTAKAKQILDQFQKKT